MIQNAIMIQVTNTDELMGMPPSTGMVNATLLARASTRASLKPSKLVHLFFSCYITPGRGQ